MPSAQPFDLDCLFVHVPKAANHYLPLGDFFNITYMPMGLPALSDWSNRAGFRTEIVHLGVEWIRDAAFDLIRSLDGMRIGAFGLPLYWHYQTYDVIEVARRLKAAHPEALVFLGGLTAGYFADQILRVVPEIDAVIQGPGEGAIVPLLEAVRRGDRDGLVDAHIRGVDGSIGRTPSSTVRPALDELVYGNLSVIRNAATYAELFGFPLSYSTELSAEENRRHLAAGIGKFPLFVGRGCPWSCTFCGGNRDTLRRVNGSSKPEWRSMPRVLDDIRRALDHGYRAISTCFDPIPERDDYFVSLFDAVGAAGLDVDWYFECWGLPTERFVSAFKRAFPGPRSTMALSPDAGSERVRKRNKQPYYDDGELLATMRMLESHEVPTDVFYTMALPGETLVSARETRDQMARMREFRNARRVMVWTVQLEPGSPQFEHPERCGMVTDRKTFADYHRVHGGRHADTYSSLGFKILDYFGDQRDRGDIRDFERHVQSLKCAELCFLSADPRQPVDAALGRGHCLERRRDLATRRGRPLPTRALGPGYEYDDAVQAELPRASPRFHWLEPLADPPPVESDPRAAP